MSLPDLKFRIIGEDQFSKSLASLGSQMTSLGSQLKAFGSTTEDASKKTQTLGDIAKTAIGYSLGKIAVDAMRSVIAVGDEAAQSFMEYESTMARIISASNTFGEESKALASQLSKVAESQTDLGFSAREAALGLESLVKAGMAGEDAATALRAALSLARLESVDTATASNLLISALTMFHKTADESIDVVNSLSKAATAGIGTATEYASGLSNCGAAAANMGLSLEETLAALVQLDSTYNNAIESGTYLNAMFKDLVAKSDDLGISLYNTDGSMRSLDDIIGQLRGNVASFGDNQEAVNNYLSVFDVRAQKAVLGLINYDGSISDTMSTMNDAHDVQDKLNQIMDTTAGKMDELAAQQENISRQYGEMTANLQLTWKQFALGLGPIGAVVDALGPAMLQGAMLGVATNLPSIISGFRDAASSVDIFGSSLSSILGTAFSGVGIGLALAGAISLIGSYFKGLYDSVEHTDEEIARASNMMDDYTESLIDAAKNAMMPATEAQKSLAQATEEASEATKDEGEAAKQAAEEAEAMTKAMQKQMDVLETSFFDVFTKNTDEFKDALDSAAQTVYADMADMDGSFTVSQATIAEFAERFGLSWDDAEKSITDAVVNIKKGLESVPLTMEQELINKAQSHLEEFKNCVSGKGMALGSSFTDSWSDIVNDTNSLIQQGLLGQAQNNIQAFANCVVGKQAKMVDDIDGYLDKLQDQYDENIKKINDLTAKGLDKEAALYTAQNQDILAKMQQLAAWKEQLIKPGIIPLTVSVTGVTQAQATLTSLTSAPTIEQLQAAGYIKMKEGGIVEKPTLAVLGEKGPEAVVPLGRNKTLTSREPIGGVSIDKIIINAPNLYSLEDPIQVKKLLRTLMGEVEREYAF
jgi:TP901 family phage tail tape measure protein